MLHAAFHIRLSYKHIKINILQVAKKNNWQKQRHCYEVRLRATGTAGTRGAKAALSANSKVCLKMHEMRVQCAGKLGESSCHMKS